MSPKGLLCGLVRWRPSVSPLVTRLTLVTYGSEWYRFVFFYCTVADLPCKLCFRVVFKGWESTPIRSAVKFYFDIDVRKCFQLFQKIFFQSIQKLKFYFLRFFGNFQYNRIGDRTIKKPQITTIKKNNCYIYNPVYI